MMRMLAALAILLSITIGIPAQSAASDTVEAPPAADAVDATAPWQATVAATTGWVVDRTRPIAIRVVVNVAEITGVTVQSAAIIEETTATLLPAGWVLCPKERERCEGTPLVLQHGSHELWLHPPLRVTFNGSYNANVVIVSAEEPVGQTLTFKFYGKMTGYAFLGFIMILLGVAIAALVTIWVPNQTNRTQLLLPAARLRERATRFRNEIATIVRKPGEKTHVETLTKDLGDAITALLPHTLELDGLVPGSWAMGITGTPSENYSERLKTYTAWLDAAGIVISEGILKAEAIRSSHLEDVVKAKAAYQTAKTDASTVTANPAATDEAKTAAITKRDAAQALTSSAEAIVAAAEKAIKDLADLLAPAPPAPVATLDIVIPKVEAIMAELAAAEAGPNAQAAPAGARTSRLRPRGSSELLVNLRQLQLASWIAFAALAVVVGTLVLIVQPPSFGTPQDFFWCFLWGFGLPVGAGQLTLSNVRTSLSIPTPASV